MTSATRKLIGARLKAHRLSKNVTQANVAEAMDCEVTTIGRYESGAHSPDGEQLIRLANYFGVSPIDFLPTTGDIRRQTIIDLRSALADIVFTIDEPSQLQQLIAAAERFTKR